MRAGFATGRRGAELLGGIAIVLAGWAALHPVLHHGFLQVGFDDPGFVTEVETIGPWSWQRVRMCFDRFYLYDYVPLPMLSFLLDYQLWGFDPRGYHATNLLLHLLAAVLVQRWVSLTLGNLFGGWLAGIVFALHPVQVETVAVVAQRKTLLSTVFLLLALLAYRRYLVERAARWNALGLTAFAAACLSKSSVVPFPLLLLLYDWLHRRPLEWRSKIPYFLLAAAVAALSIYAKSDGVIKPPHGESVLATVLVMSRVWWEYVFALFVPIHLSPAYYYQRAGVVSWENVLALAFLVALLVAAWLYRHRARWGVFCLGWILLALLPVANIVPIAVVRADRYLYLPLIAFGLWVGSWWIGATARTAARKRAIGAVVALWLVGLGIQSQRYAEVFHDDVSARSRAVQLHPWAAPAHYLLALAWADRGDWQRAAAAAHAALERDANFTRARELLARLEHVSAEHSQGDEPGGAHGTRESFSTEGAENPTRKASRSEEPLREPFVLVVAFLVGAAVGSFLNVCIARLPQGKSIVFPPSACPQCGARIRPWDNIPLLSFLLLRGRCRACGQRISWRYPAVEALTGVLFTANVMVFGVSPWAAVSCVLVAALVVVTFIDLDHQIIPDVISLPGIVVGLLSAVPGWGPSLVDRVFGVLLGGGLLWAVAVFYEWVRRREGMGGGDVKLLAMIGAFLGWRGVLITLLVGSLSGSLVGASRILLRRAEAGVPIPFGPFLALGAVVALFWGEALISWYIEFAVGGVP